MVIVFHELSLELELVNVEIRLDLNHLMVDATFAISLDIRQMSVDIEWCGMDIQIMVEMFSLIHL